MIDQTRLFVKHSLQKAESAHDFSHIQRVHDLSLTLANAEIQSGNQVDLTVVQLGALLHDIADHKFHNGDENVGPARAREFLKSIGAEDKIID